MSKDGQLETVNLPGFALPRFESSRLHHLFSTTCEASRFMARNLWHSSGTLCAAICLLLAAPVAAREGAWNGSSTAVITGRLVSVAPTYGSPIYPPPPGGQQSDGCRLEVNVGPNAKPANLFDVRAVRFYKARPGYPPDICRLSPGRFVVIVGDLVTVLCEQDSCQFPVLNVVGKSIEVWR